jgi:PAS domain S-box-containing protein
VTPAPNDATAPEFAVVQPQSDEAEAITRIRLAGALGLLAEIILPSIEAISFNRPDWLVIRIQAIWFVLTLTLLGATWHPRFSRIWKPAILLFSIAAIYSSGILSVQGASLAPFMFLLVLLPIGGTILPWEPGWQAAMSVSCVVLSLWFSSQFDWQNHLVISGLSAMFASVLGSHFVSVALSKQRTRINSYLQALIGSEEKFRKIFEMSSSLIAIHSIPDGCIVDVNPAWEKSFGYHRSEVLGKLRPDLTSAQARNGFLQWVRSLKMGDVGIGDDPEVLRGRQGNPVYSVYSWSTLELNGRDCVLVVGQDITRRVQAEEELNRNREVLLNQERLKAVGELASGMAHDLNNSLNVLRLRMELLSNDQSLLERHGDSLQLIHRVVQDASSTIGRLQDFARRRHDRPIESVDLNSIIDASVEIAKSTLEERNSLSWGGRYKSTWNSHGCLRLSESPQSYARFFSICC